jgi:hypothetical protein
MIQCLRITLNHGEWVAGEHVIGGSAGALVLRYSVATNAWRPCPLCLQPPILQTQGVGANRLGGGKVVHAGVIRIVHEHDHDCWQQHPRISQHSHRPPIAFSDVLQDFRSSGHGTAHHGGLAFDGVETRTPMFPGSSRCCLTGVYSRQEGRDMDVRLENLHRMAISGEPALAAAVMFHIAIAAALSNTG